MAKPRPPLSRREREVMDVLFRLGEGTAADVLEGLADPPSYSTVRALLRILEDKGHIGHRADGPRYVYAPAVDREKARRAAVSHLVNTFFGGSAERLLLAVARRSDLEMTPEEAEQLSSAIGRARKEGR
jgi:predicted transcriptional regulator